MFILSHRVVVKVDTDVSEQHAVTRSVRFTPEVEVACSSETSVSLTPHGVTTQSYTIQIESDLPHVCSCKNKSFGAE